MSFFLRQDLDLAIARMPRCGSQSIREWLSHKAVIVANNSPELLSVSRRVAFIRNPIERLRSAFSLFYWCYHQYGKMHRSKAPIDSWELFVDHVLDDKIPDDDHWLSQTKCVGDIPNIYHKFENMLEKFEIYQLGIFPHNNKMSRRPSSNYRLLELKDKYSDDLILWEKIN